MIFKWNFHFFQNIHTFLFLWKIQISCPVIIGTESTAFSIRRRHRRRWLPSAIWLFQSIQVARCRSGLRSHRRPTFGSLERRQNNVIAAFGMLLRHRLIFFFLSHFFASAQRRVVHLTFVLVFTRFTPVWKCQNNRPSFIFKKGNFINALFSVERKRKERKNTVRLCSSKTVIIQIWGCNICFSFSTPCHLKNFFPGLIAVVYVLRPSGLLQKAISEVSNKFFREDFKFKVRACTCLEILACGHWPMGLDIWPYRLIFITPMTF